MTIRQVGGWYGSSIVVRVESGCVGCGPTQPIREMRIRTNPRETAVKDGIATDML